MPQNHKMKQELVAEGMQKSQFERFERDVIMLELRVRKNKAQKELMGVAVDARIDAFQDIEINFMDRKPELVPALIEERNMFLKSVGVPEDVYVDYLQKEYKARKDVMEQQIKAELAKQPADPSQQLHAIHEEIRAQEEVLPMGASEPPADIPPEDDVKLEDPFPFEPEPTTPASQPEPTPEQHDPILYPAEDPLP